MYLQITTRCNMTCEHCCNSCTEDGEDMSLEVFRAALLESGWDYVMIGGGEPTLHPLFWQFLGESIAEAEGVWLATNGSQTNIALALAKMAQKGVIGCALSQDIYHDPIEDSVVEAFTQNRSQEFRRHEEDSREIRDVTSKEINAGRCDFGDEDRCVCSGIIVKPNGDIHGCGCDDAPKLGTVFSPEIPEGWDSNECHKEQEELAVMAS